MPVFGEQFMLPSTPKFGYVTRSAVVVVEAQPSDLYLTETTAMIIIGIILSVAAIGVFCRLLFTLAVFALPFLAGVSAGTWGYQTGAGWLGAILVGMVAAGLTLGIGQILLTIVRPVWARLLIELVFVAPAVVAGYHATEGIVEHTIPSETWQFIFSSVGALAVGVTAFSRIAGMAATGPSGQSPA